MIDMPDVETLMAAGLRDWLEQKSAERTKARDTVRRTQIAGVVSALALGLIGLIFGVPFQFLIFGALLVGGSFFAWANHIRQNMVDDLKQEMNGALARSLGIEYSVQIENGEQGAEFQLAEEYDLLPSWDDSYFQDQWHGAAAGTDFLLYEVKLTETRGSGKNRHTVTVFEGIVLRMRFARSFIGTTLVRRDGFKFTLFGDSKSYGGEKLERIKMVEPRFEDAFDVYGNDQVESRYLVHPAYIERLLELEKQFEGEKLCALFHGGDLLVTIQTGDMFESATLNPDEDRELLGQTIEQFASIARLIQTLNERARA
jgi:hypothetical protein